jgi:hypothetical protein
MSAQAIESVSQQSMKMINSNQSSSSIPDLSETSLINEKINTATTLAILVGLVQVRFIK